MIQADKGLTARLPLDPHKRRGQLQPIRCTQGVPLEGVRGIIPDGLTGEDLRPHLRQDKLYIKEKEGILHEVKISPAAYRRDVPCSCP